MTLSPNPASGETTVTIEPTSEEVQFDETRVWEMEVFSETQVLKMKNTRLKGRSAKIQTTGWKAGVYFVRVSCAGEVLQGKLLVKK